MNGDWTDNMATAAATINRFAGEDCVYRRGNSQSSLRMRPQAATYPAKVVSPIVEQWQGTDFIVTVDEWQRSGLTAPARGDKIDRLLRGSIVTYELVAPPGTQLWDIATFGEVYAIHTQQVAA